MGHSLLYLMFTSGLMIAATGVIFMRTPIHSLLLLIITFFNAAGLFLVWGAEFLAMLLVIVYVGAVAVLFLFVVMMLNVDSSKLKFSFSKYTGFSAFLAFVIFIELICLVFPWQTWIKSIDIIALPITQSITNTHAIGNVLYTQYFYIFQLSGLMLLVAMMGAILLSFKGKRDMNTQKIADQLKRSPENTLVMKKVEFKKGVEL
jgi:NADH-quinone oxidoreductase subunit J